MDWPWSSTIPITWRRFIAPITTQADFQKYRIFTVHITALIGLTLILSHFWFRAIPWIFTLYLVWSPWHYSGQNYGLFMMFARRGGATPSAAGRQALYSAFLISYLILFLSFMTGASNDPLFVSPGIPERISYVAVLVLGVAFIGCSAYGWSGLAKQVGWRRLLPALTLFSTQCLWFLLPTVLSIAEGLRTSAEPLQQWSVRGHALSPISLDHQLLRAT